MFRRSRHTKRVRSNKRTESRAFRREYNSIRWQEARNIRPLFFMVFRNNKRMNEGQLKLLAENRDILAKTVDKVKARNPTVKDGPEREKKQKLLGQINEVLNNVSSISDPDFSLQKLAEAVGSNTKYVSQVINEYYNKNFKTLLNEYRLREATRRLNDQEHYGNMTIQAIYEEMPSASYELSNGCMESLLRNIKKKRQRKGRRANHRNKIRLRARLPVLE